MLRSSLPLVLPFALAGTLASSAQTKSATPAHRSTTVTHRSTTVTHRSTTAHPAAKPACVVVPTLSPKIPALPAGTPCPKALFTISERLDFVSPLVGPTVREGFSNLPMTFTLAYVDTKVGTGDLAKPHMYYTVHYTGYTLDGEKFDSSYDHPDKEPLTFPYGGHRVIPGWDTGFEGMHVGGKRRLFIPFQLAYGERGRPPMIPPKAELVFDMELLSQSEQPPAPQTPPPPSTPPTPQLTVPRPLPPTSPGQPGSLPPTPPTGTVPGSPATPPTPTSPAAPAAPTAPGTPTTPPQPTPPTPGTSPTQPH